MADEIDLDEMLAEYARLGMTSEGKGLTTAELCERWKLGTDAVLRRLKLAQKAGILRCGRKPGTRLDGVPTPVPCYWVERPKGQPKQTKRGKT